MKNEGGIVETSQQITDFVAQSLNQEKRFETADSMHVALVETLSSKDEGYGAFISYRVATDTIFADTLYSAASMTQMRQGIEHHMLVYLDRIEIKDGEEFGPSFIKALASSTVFAPLLSIGCIQSFVGLDKKDRQDFVLVEWMIALELHKQKRAPAIFPILLGEQDDLGQWNEDFFATLRSGKVRVDGQLHALPDVVSQKTVAKARSLLGQLEPPVELTEELTVAGVVRKLLEFQSFLPHFCNQLVGKQLRTRSGAMVMPPLNKTQSEHRQDSSRELIAERYAQRIFKVWGEKMESAEKEVTPFLEGDYMRQPGSRLFSSAANLFASASRSRRPRMRTFSAKSLAVAAFVTAGARPQRAMSMSAASSTDRASQLAEARDQATQRAKGVARP